MAPLLSSCLNLDKVFNLSVPQFPNMQNGNNHNIVMLNELAHVKYFKYALVHSKCSVNVR